MKKYCKNILKIISFISIIIFVGYNLYNVLLWKDTSGVGGFDYKHFYETEKNTVDVMFYGSSHNQCTINNAILYDEFGIVSYNLSAGGKSLDTTYYDIVESLKYQDPDVLVVELVFSAWVDDVNEGNLYRNTLNIKYSDEFYNNVVNVIPEDRQQDVLLKWPIFHTRYKELSKADFVDYQYYERGYCGSWRVTPMEVPLANSVTDVRKIDSEKEEWINKIIALSYEYDKDLIFYVAPFGLNEDNQKCFNYVEELCKKRGIYFVNFNTIHNEIGLDYNQDFREASHLNNFGAAKVTQYIGSILVEKYRVTQHTDKENYEFWNLNSSSYNNDVLNYNLVNISSVDELYTQLPKEGYDVALYVNSSVQGAHLSKINRESCYDFVNEPGFYYVSNGQKEYYNRTISSNYESYSYSKQLDKYIATNITVGYSNVRETVNINYNNNFFTSDSDISIFVYDRINKCPVAFYKYSWFNNTLEVQNLIN